MSLRYLDINPTPVSEEGIYGISKYISGDTISIQKYLPNKMEEYINDELSTTTECLSCSEGFVFSGAGPYSFFYNPLINKYWENGFQEQSYSGDMIFQVAGLDNSFAKDVRDFIITQVDYFSSSAFITIDKFIKYIGKKENKICELIINTSNNLETTIIEYNGQKIKDIKGTDIYWVVDLSGVRSGEYEFCIFKVGRYLYKYDVSKDFIDDNIILWAILPEDINNLSIGVEFSEDDLTYISIFLIDADAHKYYTATFTDTPPVENTALITFKKKDGTSKSYNAIKFIKKDGTSKTYTKVRFDKINGGD